MCVSLRARYDCCDSRCMLEKVFVDEKGGKQLLQGQGEKKYHYKQQFK